MTPRTRPAAERRDVRLADEADRRLDRLEEALTLLFAFSEVGKAARSGSRGWVKPHEQRWAGRLYELARELQSERNERQAADGS